MLEQYELLIINIIGCILTASNLGYSIYTAIQRQQKAYMGDAVAAKRIILPCFKPLMKALIVIYVIISVLLSFLFLDDDVTIQRIDEYYGFTMITMFSIIPVLLTHRSISNKAFMTTFYIIFPWWVLCTLLWGLSFLPDSVGITICFIICSSILPSVFAICTLTKIIPSRIQLGSTSNRNATELFLVYCLIYGTTYLAKVIRGSSHYYSDIVFASLTFIVNQLFPYALYRTLLADTKFWRGMGKHNQGGIDIHDDLRNSGVEVHRPTIELNMINSSLQLMLADIDDITIDFAYLQLERLIGQGATAKVYCGKLKGKLSAIKLSTPPEITEEVIDVFVSEAKVASQLKHKNIVAFLGICVRPPQICMIFEFCEGGNLKSNLLKNSIRWTPLLRLQACLDATRAIAYLHLHNYIHRDIKAENFFVGKRSIVKLGDFGEASFVRNEESTKSERMSILGTVAYMAPELILAERYYTQAIDIYALGVTFWEIWTGQDPYDDCTTFDIYEKVKRGERPPLPTNSFDGFNELLTATWQAKASDRPTATQVLEALENILKRRKGVHVTEPDNGTTGGDELDHDIDDVDNPPARKSIYENFVSNPLFTRKMSVTNKRASVEETTSNNLTITLEENIPSITDTTNANTVQLQHPLEVPELHDDTEREEERKDNQV